MNGTLCRWRVAGITTFNIERERVRPNRHKNPPTNVIVPSRLLLAIIERLFGLRTQINLFLIAKLRSWSHLVGLMVAMMVAKAVVTGPFC